ncbi:MAG: ATP-binding cassette domain-containing protein [Dehalococcoidia bacterium]
MSQGHVIEVENLTKRFKSVTAVDGVSFGVKAGEVFGFLGPNGAGKTTTINILCTLVRPTSGRAMLCGFDVVRQRSQVRQSIGLVFQDPSLDDRLTAQDNLKFHAFIYNIPARLRQRRIEEVLRMVELWDRRDSLVKTFSGGMKRRLEIARGLIHFPRVLFLDEPTLGLDPQSRSRIWEYIAHLREEEKITIFLTTHYMDEAENADRIAVIDRGRIVALDTPEALKRRVGGDIISLRTADDDRAMEEVRERFDIQAQRDSQGLTFEVKNGSEFIPSLVGGLGIEVLSISLRRPTLDDVFLKLTGRELRDSELGGRDIMRAEMRHGPHGRR